MFYEEDTLPPLIQADLDRLGETRPLDSFMWATLSEEDKTTIDDGSTHLYGEDRHHRQTVKVDVMIPPAAYRPTVRCELVEDEDSTDKTLRIVGLPFPPA